MKKRQSFSAQICPLPTPLTQIKMHVRKELPLCMGDGGGGGGVRRGSEIMCVCCKFHFPTFKQRGEYVCNVCIFSVLQKKKKKKKETERKWKGSLSLRFIKPSCACCYSAYSLILQLIQFLHHPLSHQIQSTVKLTFSVQSHPTTTTALLTQISIRAARFW